MTKKREKQTINDLTPAPYNPRVMPPSEQLKLKNGLQTFGLVDPIIIDLTDNNTVIGGHQRLEVLREIDDEQELTLIPLGDIGLVIREHDLKIRDKNDQKALNLALNKIQGDWDYGKLDDLLLELNDDHYQIELTGFSDEDLLLQEGDYDSLDDLLPDGNEFPTDEEVIQGTENTEDKTPSETPYTPLKEVKVIVKEGDKYQLGNHVLLCADSSERENIEKLLSGEKVDLLLTDPPYGINVVNTTGTEREREHVKPEEKTGLVGVYAKLGFAPRNNKTGTVGGPGMVKPREYKPVIGDDQAYDPQVLLELDCPSIIWGANNFASKLPDKNQWIVWYKQPKENTYNTFSDCELAWTNLPKKRIRMYKYLWSGLLREGPRDEELQERVHPTQKPVGLLKNIIQDTLTGNNKNILDLYGGSGSTLIASEILGHNCYMMEIDPYYCQIIINRWEEYTGQKAEKMIT